MADARKPSSEAPFRLLDLPLEIREMIYLHALKPFPARIHLPQGPIRLWSLVPNFNPGERMNLPALFFVSKQLHHESTRIFFKGTSLALRLKQIQEPLSKVFDCTPTVAKLNIRTVDLRLGSWYLDSSMTENVISSIRENFPCFRTVRLTLEQRISSPHNAWLLGHGGLFSISRRTLQNLLDIPERLTSIRIFVQDAFQRRPETLILFEAFLNSLSPFPHLEEVEVYFQTIVRGFIMYPTPTHTPEPAPTRAGYLALERKVLSPYLSSLASALPHVKHFQVWRLRTRCSDQKTGTQPIKEKELLDLLGGRATDIDSQAGFPVVKRFPDGSAADW
jgi:hypothetical protein